MAGFCIRMATAGGSDAAWPMVFKTEDDALNHLMSVMAHRRNMEWEAGGISARPWWERGGVNPQTVCVCPIEVAA